MSGALRQIVLLSFTSLLAWPCWAGEVSYKKCQYYKGIANEFTIGQVFEADLDGDSSDEVVISYREPQEAEGQRGGVLILSSGASGCQVAWHAMFDRFYPKKISATGKALTFELVWKKSGGSKQIEKTLVRGKDFFFRSEEGSPFSEVKVKASSSLRSDDVTPENVFDGDLKTGWAEGSEGTGVDETLNLEFSKPVPLALIGVLHGNFKGKRYWLDNNRLHRAEVVVETHSDRYDADSDVDFSEDLGLGLYGDRLDLAFSNKPVMRYFRLAKRDIISLELKITSVLLGEKNDDTWVSEIDLVELIPGELILGQAAAPKKKEKKKEEEPEEDDDWTDDF